MKVKGQFTPEQTICKWRWSYPVVYIKRGEVRTCDKPYNFKLTEKDFKRYGTDAFINHPYLLERRREKLQGKRHKSCFSCIRLEDQGFKSSRAGKADFVKYMNQQEKKSGDFKDFTSKIRPDLLRADHPEILEISLSNLCNLACVYCSYVLSSRWEDEDIQLGKLNARQKESQINTPPSFEKYFWLWFKKIIPSLNRIIFIGGEPLLNKEFPDYLQKMNEIIQDSTVPKDKRITINIITNMNIPKAKYDAFLDALEQMDPRYIIHLEASVESYGDRASYIRHGLNWNLFQRNIEATLKRKLPHLRFGFQMAINALCISSLLDLLKYAVHLQNKYDVMVDYKENTVISPEPLAPYVLTPDFAKYIEECRCYIKEHLASDKNTAQCKAYNEASKDRWKLYLDYLDNLQNNIQNTSTSSRHRREFYEFIRNNDQIRQLNFIEIFPEYKSFYELCKASTPQFWRTKKLSRNIKSLLMPDSYIR